MPRAVELVGQEGAASTEQDTEQQAEHDRPRPAHADGTARQRGEINDLHLPRLHRLRNARFLIFRPQLVGDAPRVLDLLRQQLVDRKSTRLNSSHSQISYAVFCLKKKKK